MRRIDQLHLEYPFAGARTLRDLLRAEGWPNAWPNVINGLNFLSGLSEQPFALLALP
jgi:hypothetical protein